MTDVTFEYERSYLATTFMESDFCIRLSNLFRAETSLSVSTHGLGELMPLINSSRTEVLRS